MGIFALLVACHLVGDYLLQTDWQALHKRVGLGRDRVARRALLTHVVTYTLAFVPALIWLASDLGPGVLWVAALIGAPHVVQDHGGVVAWWMRRVKRADIAAQPLVALPVDQTIHVVSPLGVALAAGA